MSDFNPDNRKKALAFAEELAELARHAPSREIKSQIMIVANNVRVVYGMTDQEKLETVFMLIVDGAATVADLEAETGFTRQKINEIIISLKNLRRVRVCYINSGRPGPPRQLIMPVNAGIH